MLNSRAIVLILVIAAIVGSIYYLESLKAHGGGPAVAPSLSQNNLNSSEPLAPEIVNPSGFINIDPSTGLGTGKITIGEQKGKKVVLVDFWTYSCINCQRTTPILNAWYEKYSGMGLEIIGVHTPEFEFEKNIENVKAAVKRENIKYPVVLDNDYDTWNAYGNRYWPRQYLINIDGKIATNHIGEFSEADRASFENQIQKLLDVKIDMTSPKYTSVDSSKPLSPETYLGSKRSQPSESWSLAGDWDVQSEFAQNQLKGAKIVYKYQAKEVYLVGSSVNGVKIKVMLDGKLVGEQRGEDVGADGILTIKEDRLYKIIQDSAYGQHTLELEILSPGLKAFAFTFG